MYCYRHRYVKNVYEHQVIHEWNWWVDEMNMSKQTTPPSIDRSSSMSNVMSYNEINEHL